MVSFRYSLIPPQLPLLRHTNPAGQSPSLPAGFPFPSDPGVAEKLNGFSYYLLKIIFIVYSLKMNIN